MYIDNVALFLRVSETSFSSFPFEKKTHVVDNAIAVRTDGMNPSDELVIPLKPSVSQIRTSASGQFERTSISLISSNFLIDIGPTILQPIEHGVLPSSVLNG